ncbi:hypothetical protein [Desulfurobacterium crinifex]
MWNNPLTWQILTAVIGGITIILGISQVILIRKKKELCYELLQNIPLIKIDSNVKNRIEIFFDGKNVSDVSLILFRIINSGNVPITRDDIIKPIIVNFGDNSKILELSIERKKPPNIEMDIITKKILFK